MSDVRRMPGQPKPVGQPTRGKTAPNRLRRVDLFLVLALDSRVRIQEAVYVDLGFGAEPTTTLQTAAWLRRFNPTLRVVGVEIDPERVAAALPYVQPGLDFRLGGFNLPLTAGETPQVIRALNVLRQYEEAEVPNALSTLGRCLAEGGVILEGTSDPAGRLLAFNVLERHRGLLVHRWLVLSTNFRQPFHPLDWRPVLPKALIHRAGEGDVMGQFFTAYVRAYQGARGAGVQTQHHLFAASAARLRDEGGYPALLRARLLRRGFLVLACPPDAGWSLGALPLAPDWRGVV